MGVPSGLGRNMSENIHSLTDLRAPFSTPEPAPPPLSTQSQQGSYYKFRQPIEEEAESVYPERKGPERIFIKDSTPFGEGWTGLKQTVRESNQLLIQLKPTLSTSKEFWPRCGGSEHFDSKNCLLNLKELYSCCLYQYYDKYQVLRIRKSRCFSACPRTHPIAF